VEYRRPPLACAHYWFLYSQVQLHAQRLFVAFIVWARANARPCQPVAAYSPQLALLNLFLR
jgi:hypothetical protein